MINILYIYIDTNMMYWILKNESVLRVEKIRYKKNKKNEKEWRKGMGVPKRCDGNNHGTLYLGTIHHLSV